MPPFDETLPFPSLLHRLTNPERILAADTTGHQGVTTAAVLATEISLLLGQPCFLPAEKAPGITSRQSTPFQTLPQPITPGPYTVAGLEGLRRQVLALLKAAEPRLTALSVTTYQHDGEGGLMIEGQVGPHARHLTLHLPLWPSAGLVQVEAMDEDRWS